MSLGDGLFPTKSSNSWKLMIICGIKYLSNRMSKFLQIINISGIRCINPAGF